MTEDIKATVHRDMDFVTKYAKLAAPRRPFGKENLYSKDGFLLMAAEAKFYADLEAWEKEYTEDAGIRDFMDSPIDYYQTMVEWERRNCKNGSLLHLCSNESVPEDPDVSILVFDLADGNQETVYVYDNRIGAQKTIFDEDEPDVPNHFEDDPTFENAFKNA